MAKKVVVIGGGHGLAVILRGLKQIEDIDIKAIVTVADDGGSTGRLREQYQIPAMGDIRNVMLALGSEDSLFSTLMDYRFDGSEDIGGHNLGNLILTALTQITGSFNEAIGEISKVLNVNGEIIPATNEVVTLYAEMDDGVIVRGESNIPKYHHHIDRIFYDHPVKANPIAIKALEEADLIVLGLGSLYTSILPNLIIKDIKNAIKNAKAPIVYVCNAMSQGGETDAYTVEDHVAALSSHLKKNCVTHVIVNTTEIPEDILVKYEEEHAHQILLGQTKHTYQVIEQDLLDLSKGNVRHNPLAIATEIKKILDGVD